MLQVGTKVILNRPSLLREAKIGISSGYLFFDREYKIIALDGKYCTLEIDTFMNWMVERDSVTALPKRVRLPDFL